MKRKLVIVLVAALIGAGVGAALGYGPLLKYRSDGTLGVEMSLPEYKRITEVADAPATLHWLAAVVPLPAGLSAGERARLDAQVGQGLWHTPIPKVSKAEAASVPDALLQPDDDKRFAYLGVSLAYVDHDPVRAAQVATWLGTYFKEVAVHEALRSQVERWAAANRQFADRLQQRRLQYAFDMEQAQVRAKAWKTIVAGDAGAERRGSRQLADVPVGADRTLTPMAQLVGAEAAVIDLQGKMNLLDRQAGQQDFARPLIAEAQEALDKAKDGAGSLTQVSELVARYAKAASTDAEREVLASMAGDVSQIGARFLSQARFVALPSVPTSPQRPSPRMVIVLCALLAAFLGAAFVWRELLVKLLWEGDDEARTVKSEKTT
ncbi:MAG: hypothetical protein JSR49_10435 [Proteobacteria bacterium]|nr:hypothetical protein [Pseudomonadota bacterium]